MPDPTPQETLLRGEYVICPASGVDGVMDVLVQDGRIAADGPDLQPGPRRRSRMCAAGWCCRA